MIYDKLFDWQKSIVDNYKNRKSFGLWLDCGLGKTPLSLAFAEMNNCTKTLVVTINAKALEKKDVNGSWLDWASQSSIDYILNDKKQDKYSKENNDLLVINYESLFKRGKDKSVRYKVELKDNVKEFVKSCENHNVAIIIDESHKVKDMHSQQSLAINNILLNLKPRAKNIYLYLLTGTPFTTGYIDLYAQLKLLGYEDTKTCFIDTYCIQGHIPGLLGWQQPIVGYRNLKQLYDVVHQFAITIKSEEVIKLPEQVFVNHPIKCSEEFNLFCKEKIKASDLQIYCKKRKIDAEKEPNKDKLVNNPFYCNIDYPNLDYLCETAGQEWLRARQLSIGFQGNAEKCVWYDKTRLNELKRFLSNNESNYLLFYNYTPELLELYQICEDLGYNIDVYSGECKSLVFYEKYSNQSEEERLTNKKNIILANFASGSTGMNWQNYNECIIFSTPLFKDYEQGIKRIHRTGQKETTIYHLFYQENWLDKSMQNALNKSIQYNNDMFKEGLKKIQESLNF